MSRTLRRRMALIAAAISVALISPAEAQDLCKQWDVGGTWQITQSNGFTPTFTLKQTGTNLVGSAEFIAVDKQCAQTATCPRIGGSADGSIRGESFSLNVYWKNGTTGVYTGNVGLQGRILGNTYDQKKPSSTASWHSNRTMTCLAQSGGTSSTQSKQGGGAADKPIKILGKRRPAQSAQACKSGYVWREARPGDVVCVTPESRTRAAQENRTAASRRLPGGGAHGPATCSQGFVWREAFDGDVVCVTPEVRTLVRQENQNAAQRQAGQ